MPPAPTVAQRQEDRLGRRRTGLADRRARPGAAGLSSRHLRWRHPRRRDDPQPDSQSSGCRKKSSTRRSATSPRMGPEMRLGQRVDSLKGLLDEGLRRGLRRLRRAARTRPGSAGPAGGSGQHPYRHRLAVLGFVRPYQQDRPARDRAGRRQHGDGLLPVVAPPGWRRREGHRPLGLRGDEGVALGKGGRDQRGHSDPELPRAEGIQARQRPAVRHDVREGEGRIRRTRPPQAGADRRAGSVLRM